MNKILLARIVEIKPSRSSDPNPAILVLEQDVDAAMA